MVTKGAWRQAHLRSTTASMTPQKTSPKVRQALLTTHHLPPGAELAHMPLTVSSETVVLCSGELHSIVCSGTLLRLASSRCVFGIYTLLITKEAFTCLCAEGSDVHYTPPGTHAEQGYGEGSGGAHAQSRRQETIAYSRSAARANSQQAHQGNGRAYDDQVILTAMVG